VIVITTIVTRATGVVIVITTIVTRAAAVVIVITGIVMRATGVVMSGLSAHAAVARARGEMVSDRQRGVAG
jgi:hypothetical protein